MNILAFDTSLNKTYLALSHNENIITETIESTEDKYEVQHKDIIQETSNTDLSSAMPQKNITISQDNLSNQNRILSTVNSAINYCRHCGKKIDYVGNKYCKHCGKELF